VAAASREPSPSAVETATLTYRCDHFAFSSATFDEPAFDLESVPAGVTLAQFLEGQSARDFGFPRGEWHLAGMTKDAAEFVAEIPEDPGYAAISLFVEQGEWRIGGYGGCRPGVDIAGLNTAIWYLVSDQPIGPTTTSFLVDVIERECASGRSSVDRVRPPLIAYQATRVVIAFAVEPLSGAQECPSNPATRIRVELSEPLGDRMLLDAGELPWRDPTTPRF
jgi:hypothetical protein